jgi:capsular polysaccharide export protein
MTPDSSFSAPSRRRFLFLQGPHGPFFRTMARRLAEQGFGVARINFNGGDKGDWDLPGTLCYGGTPESFPAFLQDYVRLHGITDIVFYSYWRPVHQAALRLPKELNVRLHGFEEGLLRPHWITCDPRLPCEQAAALRQQTGALLMREGDALPEPKEAPALKSSFWKMIGNCLRHYVNYFNHRADFPGYRTHRLVSAAEEFRAWIPQVALYPFRKVQSAWRLSRALKDKRPFFLLCLQLDGDSQITRYSSKSGMVQVLEETIASFAAFAPADARLIVKNHPLDNGKANLPAACRRIARAHGVAHRVSYLGFGKLAGLVKATRGMVTINSTSGLQALFHGCPVKTLGEACYNIPGLVHEGPLDSFWANPMTPCPRTYRAMHAVLVETTQIAGGYHSEENLDALVSAALEKMGVVQAKAAEAQAGNVIPLRRHTA